MRKRKIRLITKVFGMTTPIGIVKVGTLAKMRDISDRTERVCPSCGKKPEHSQEYQCACGFKASWWGALKQILKATGEEILKPRLTQEKEIPDAPLYKMSMAEFRKRVVASIEDNAVKPEDEISAKNLRKLIIATEILGSVIVTKFNDTYEERVGAITLNPDDTIVIKELIPDNLLEVADEVLKADRSSFTPGEIEEAKAFLAMIPEATDSTFTVNDYRTTGLAQQTVSPKVMELEAIIASAKAKQ